MDRQEAQVLADAHLVLNHTTPEIIIKTLKNPNLQFSKDFKDKLVRLPLSYEGFLTEKLKSAPHQRKQHSYVPGQAINSDVKGPLNFAGERPKQAYFITCVDASSYYEFSIPLKDRTKFPEFIEDTIRHFIEVFGKPPLVFISDNAREYVSSTMQTILNSFHVQYRQTTAYNAQEMGWRRESIKH